MSWFLLLGLILGILAVGTHLCLCSRRKESASVGAAIELLFAAIGVVGGIKICRYAVTGELTTALKNIPDMSPEDVVYFFIGGFALTWLSLESLWRRLYPSPQKEPHSERTTTEHFEEKIGKTR